MNLDNYKAKPIYILKKMYLDGTQREFIELISDDRKAIGECCEAHNTIATTCRYDLFYYVETRIAYFK